MFLSSIPVECTVGDPNNQVGDGLEMYIVLAKGRTLPETVMDLLPEELSSRGDGERVFVLKRDLKKD